MINIENIYKVTDILSKEINNNLNLSGKGDITFNLLCQAQGSLKVLTQKLAKQKKDDIQS